MLTRINQSNAGVVASYNASTGQITLTNKNTGPQSIVLGSGSDSSNFLSATGLTTAGGATTSIGKQASVTVQNGGGPPQTIYSSSNAVTTAIPGVQINVTGAAASPFQITVTQDSSSLVSALNTFVSAYNAAINEINSATAPPVVPTSPAGTGMGAPSTPVGGGVLYNNADVNSIKNELVQMVTAFNPNGGAYSSLSAIGLDLTSSFSELAQNTSSDATGASTQQISTQTMAGTDGQLQPLNVQQLQQALAANPNAVQALFNGPQGLVTQMGTYLTSVTGMPTNTANALLGAIPSVSLVQGFENTNSSNIQSLQQQIAQIQDNVNMQADAMRTEFVQAETQIAQYQSLQSQLGSFFNQNGQSGG